MTVPGLSFPFPFSGGSYGNRSAYATLYGNPAHGAGAGNARTAIKTGLPIAAGGTGGVPNYPDQSAIAHSGIRAGEIVAWRCWILQGGAYLISTYTRALWRPGFPMTGNPNEPPGGVYAWKDKQHAVNYATMICLFQIYPVIIGRVKLWGQIIEHEKGYRAEYAKITSIDNACLVPQGSSVLDYSNLVAALEHKYLGATA